MSVSHLRAVIKVSVVIRQVSVMFKVSGVIQLTVLLSCCTVRSFFNVKADTVVMLVAEKLAEVHVLNMLGFYIVVL